MTEIPGRDADFTVKIVMVGDSAVGKSSLVLRWTSNSFDPDQVSTVGFATVRKLVIVADKLVEVMLWDTAGTDRFRSVSPSYYRSAIGASLVYSIDSAQSFANLTRWLDDLKEHTSANSVCLLVGNKSDLSESRVVSDREGLDFAKAHHISFMETSAKEAAHVNEAFDLLLSTIVKNLVTETLRQNEGSRRLSSGITIESPVDFEETVEAEPASYCC
jgi:Ras-related protein Rab-11A